MAVMHTTEAPPVAVPPGHVGPVVLPNTGRLVYWTGRVAIGLRYDQAKNESAMVPESTLWVQELMLKAREQLKPKTANVRPMRKVAK